MIGTSLPEYVFIRASVAALRIITPLSIAYCGFSIIHPPQSIGSKLLLAWASLESAFYILVYLPRKYTLQRAAAHPALPSPADRDELFQRCCRTTPNPESYLSKWFLGSEHTEIKRENVKDFFRWAFLNTGEYTVADDQELDKYTDGMETLLEREIPRGRGKAKSLRLTIDRVDLIHRPLLYYGIVGLIDTGTAFYLRFNSFQLYATPLASWLKVFPFRVCSLLTTKSSPAPDLSYWYRPHTAKNHPPILFIHGISMGLYSYASFLADINCKEDRKSTDGEIGVIAIELMPISFRITGPMIENHEICQQIELILEAHGWNKFVLVSHSYGSVITTHLLRTPFIEPKIGPILMIDPVTFLLHLPDVAYNFTARNPRGANEHQLYYFASKDMMVSHTLARHFFWSENILWKEDVAGHPVTVSLGGRDLIVDTETVGRYLSGVDLTSEDASWKQRPWTGEGLEVLWFPDCDHAQVFERKRYRKRLVDVLHEYCSVEIASGS